MDDIDWEAPWLAMLRDAGQSAEALMRSGASVAQALQQTAQIQGLLPSWTFVAQQAMPAGVAYEAFIHQTQQIPTRNNLHDFFNGLIWLHWPLLKQRLNALQAQEISRQGVGQHRGALRDAITVLDENGALLLAPEPLCQALRERRWQELFVQHRALWQQAQLVPIGHALLEKLVMPRKAITAHVLCVPLESMGSEADFDRWLSDSEWLAPCNLARKPYLPLPILGIPGWCQENQNFSFYDDSLVFRAPRTSQALQPKVQPERDMAG